MPEIIGQKERQNAMKEIRSALKEMVGTNQFLEATNREGMYTITFEGDDGTRCSAIAYTEKKADIDRFVLHHKHKVASRVKDLAERNGIALYVDEKLILDIELTHEEQEELDARELAALEAAEESSAHNVQDDNYNADPNTLFYSDTDSM